MIFPFVELVIIESAIRIYGTDVMCNGFFRAIKPRGDKGYGETIQRSVVIDISFISIIIIRSFQHVFIHFPHYFFSQQHQ